jgi:hypothetical protein
MRILMVLPLCAVLGGCAASRQEVATRLGDQFVGKNADSLVVQFGPPASLFKMSNGGTSYVWQLAATTDIAIDRGYGSMETRSCKVSVITDPRGIVTQLNTEDSNAGNDIYAAFGAYGSICARRLGMERQS